jgi:hypothetical protein
LNAAATDRQLSPAKTAATTRSRAVTLRDFTDQAFTAPSAAAQAGHIGRGASFVDEHQPLGIESGLIVRPRGARLGHIRQVLLGRTQAFFEADPIAVEETPNRP